MITQEDVAMLISSHLYNLLFLVPLNQPLQDPYGLPGPGPYVLGKLPHDFGGDIVSFFSY